MHVTAIFKQIVLLNILKIKIHIIIGHKLAINLLLFFEQIQQSNKQSIVQCVVELTSS